MRVVSETGGYKSATVAMKHAMEDYPLPYPEELQFLIIDSHSNTPHGTEQENGTTMLLRLFIPLHPVFRPVLG